MLALQVLAQSAELQLQKVSPQPSGNARQAGNTIWHHRHLLLPFTLHTGSWLRTSPLFTLSQAQTKKKRAVLNPILRTGSGTAGIECIGAECLTLKGRHSFAPPLPTISRSVILAPVNWHQNNTTGYLRSGRQSYTTCNVVGARRASSPWHTRHAG